MQARAIGVAITCLLAIAAPLSALAQATNSVRWSIQRPGCEFARMEDGTNRYAIGNGHLALTLAVDSQELDKIKRRAEPFMALFLSIVLTGSDSDELDPNKMTLEFVQHYHAKSSALKTEELSARLHSDLKTLLAKAARDEQKHPAGKNQIEESVRTQQTTILQMIEFLQTKSLQPGTLQAEHPQASGWIFFATQNKWIHELGKQEEFILRVPVGSVTFEFPFTLPLSQADIDLRVRPREP